MVLIDIFFSVGIYKLEEMLTKADTGGKI